MDKVYLTLQMCGYCGSYLFPQTGQTAVPLMTCAGKFTSSVSFLTRLLGADFPAPPDNFSSSSSFILVFISVTSFVLLLCRLMIPYESSQNNHTNARFSFIKNSPIFAAYYSVSADTARVIASAGSQSSSGSGFRTVPCPR